MRGLLSCICLSGALIVSSNVGAAELFSGSLQTGQDAFVCSIANVGNKEVDATIEVINFSGIVQSTTVTTIPPGDARVAQWDVGGGPGSFVTAYCRADVSTGKKKVRGTFMVRAASPASTTISAVALE